MALLLLHSATLFFPFLLTLLQSTSSTSPYIALPHNLTPTLSVTDFGATGDGVTYDTSAIQSAIDSCSSTSTCLVTFPRGGTYLTATIRLKSGVVLNIEDGATLLGGTRLGDYPVEQERWYVVVAENATDVGITGGGVVDGQGLEFVKRFDEKKNVMVSWNSTGACLGDECRPRLVGFIDSINVKLSDIQLRQPAYWWYGFSNSFTFLFTFTFFSTENYNFVAKMNENYNFVPYIWILWTMLDYCG